MQPTVPAREQQALLEVGRTEVSRATTLVLTLVFLFSIVAVPLAQWIGWASPLAALGQLGDGAMEAREVRSRQGWLAGNRHLLAAMNAFETRLEDESFLRERLLPPVQLALTGMLGAGNEQAWVGRGGWLFYRPDVEYVVGSGFLDPQVLERRRRGGDAWEAPPEPDPLPALLALDADLAELGIELLVAPTPVKPMVLPAALVNRRTPPPPLQNPGWDTFVQGLEAGGVRLLDVPSWMAEIEIDGEAVYLTTDTHWTPAAMERVAERLAGEVELHLSAPARSGLYSRRPVAVEGSGDIALMLDLPAGQRLFSTQRVEVATVLAADGSAWQSDPRAEVLILGDSFTNVFSEPGLGWGGGAGLAEQLSYLLSRPVDRIALNAGGSHAARRALIDALRNDASRLSGKRVVVYQFAVRELAIGDWPVLRLPRP